MSTLEEIRLRKALKASMKRAGYPMQSPDPQANGEKENIQSLFGATLYQAEDGNASKAPSSALLVMGVFLKMNPDNLHALQWCSWFLYAAPDVAPWLRRLLCISPS